MRYYSVLAAYNFVIGTKPKDRCWDIWQNKGELWPADAIYWKSLGITRVMYDLSSGMCECLSGP